MVLTVKPYRNQYNRRERRYLDKKRSSRYGYGYYYGGTKAQPRKPLTGFRGFLHKAGKKLTKSVKVATKAVVDGVHILIGVLSALDLVNGGLAEMSPLGYAAMGTAALVALQDANAVGNWFYGNNPDPDEVAEDYSRQILELQETLAGRIRLANFGKKPTADELYSIFKRIMMERGETEDVADIGANAARAAFANSHDLPPSVGVGVQAVSDERQRRGLPPIWEVTVDLPDPMPASSSSSSSAPPPPALGLFGSFVPPPAPKEFTQQAAIEPAPAPESAVEAAAEDVVAAPAPIDDDDYGKDERPHAKGFGYYGGRLYGGAFEIAKLNHFFDWMLPILRGGTAEIKRPLTLHDWAVFGAQRGWTPEQFIGAYHKFLVDLSDYPEQYPPLMLPVPEDYYEPYYQDAPYDESLYQRYMEESKIFNNGFTSDAVWRNYMGGGKSDNEMEEDDDSDSDLDEEEKAEMIRYHRIKLGIAHVGKRPVTPQEFCIMAAQLKWNSSAFKMGLEWWFYENARKNGEPYPEPPWDRPFGYQAGYSPKNRYVPGDVKRFEPLAAKLLSIYEAKQRDLYHSEKPRTYTAFVEYKGKSIDLSDGVRYFTLAPEIDEREIKYSDVTGSPRTDVVYIKFPNYVGKPDEIITVPESDLKEWISHEDSEIGFCGDPVRPELKSHLTPGKKAYAAWPSRDGSLMFNLRNGRVVHTPGLDEDCLRILQENEEVDGSDEDAIEIVLQNGHRYSMWKNTFDKYSINQYTFAYKPWGKESFGKGVDPPLEFGDQTGQFKLRKDGILPPPRRPKTVREFCIMAAQKAWDESTFIKGFRWWYFDYVINEGGVFPKPDFPKPFGYNAAFDPMDQYDATLANRFIEIAKTLYKQYEAEQREFIARISRPPRPRPPMSFRPYPLNFYEDRNVQIPHPTLYPRGMTNPDGTLMSLKEAREKFLREHPDVKFGKGYGGVNWYEISGSGYHGGTSTAHRPKASPTPTYFKYMFMNQDELRQMPKAELIEWAMRDPDFKFWALSSKLITPQDLRNFFSRAEVNRFYYGEGLGLYEISGSGLALRGAGILSKLFGKAKELVGKVYQGARSLLS